MKLKDPKELADLLVEHHGTVEAAAHAIGVTHPTISRVRRGVTDPNFETYEKMVNGYTAIQAL